MLNQINHWVEIAATAVDLVLLLRILGLRLQRTYLFVTLACTLAVMFDVANLLFREQAPKVELYTALFSACLYPLASWDIFEEIGSAAGNLRRMAMTRTLASLIIISFLGLLWLSTLWDADDPTGLLFPLSLTFFVSTSLSASCLGFLWIMRRGLTLNQIATPRNTWVWMMFYGLTLAGDLASWLVFMVEDSLSQPIRNQVGPISTLVLNLYGIGVTLWCVAMLRGLSKDLPAEVSESEPHA